MMGIWHVQYDVANIRCEAGPLQHRCALSISFFFSRFFGRLWRSAFYCQSWLEWTLVGSVAIDKSGKMPKLSLSLSEMRIVRWHVDKHSLVELKWANDNYTMNDVVEHSDTSAPNHHYWILRCPTHHRVVRRLHNQHAMLHVTWMTLSSGSILPPSVFTQSSYSYYYFSDLFCLAVPMFGYRLRCLLVYFPHHQFFAFGQKRKNKQHKTTYKHYRCQRQILRTHINGFAKRRRNSDEMSPHLHWLNRWRHTDTQRRTHRIHYTNKIESNNNQQRPLNWNVFGGGEGIEHRTGFAVCWQREQYQSPGYYPILVGTCRISYTPLTLTCPTQNSIRCMWI